MTAETIYVPPGSRIVGESLSVITGKPARGESPNADEDSGRLTAGCAGTGSNFHSADSPQPIVMVGKPKEVGVAQFSDILFSAGDIAPGAIVVQVNMAGSKPGDVGFWNCVIRVGGSYDSIPGHTCGGADPADCKAAFALLHVGQTASAYFENIWGWVAGE